MILCEAAVEELVYDRFVATTRQACITFVELGAGHGAQTMKLFRCLDRWKDSTAVKHVTCVPVEPYPPHFADLEWNMRHYDARIVYGAVADAAGTQRFLDQWEGQSGPSFWGGQLSEIGRLTVPTYPMGQVMEMAGIEHISFIHLDIQGEEANIRGDLLDLVKRGRLENIYIGTHGAARHEILKETFASSLRVQIDVPPDTMTVTPFGTVAVKDGILCFSNSIDMSSIATLPAWVAAVNQAG